MSSFAERLVVERRRLKWTQREMADKGKVIERSQVHYEAGDRIPKVSYLINVVKHGVDPYYMITGRRDPYRK